MDKVKAFIERGADGRYGIYIDLKDNRLNYGIHGDGATLQEAIEDFEASYKEMKAYYKAKGKEFTEADFEYKYDVVSFLKYYNQYLTLSGLGKLSGINKTQLSHYIQGFKNPSVATTQKIETALHRFAEELKSIRLS